MDGTGRSLSAAEAAVSTGGASRREVSRKTPSLNVHKKLANVEVLKLAFTAVPAFYCSNQRSPFQRPPENEAIVNSRSDKCEPNRVTGWISLALKVRLMGRPFRLSVYSINF